MAHGTYHIVIQFNFQKSSKLILLLNTHFYFAPPILPISIITNKTAVHSTTEKKHVQNILVDLVKIGQL